MAQAIPTASAAPTPVATAAPRSAVASAPVPVASASAAAPAKYDQKDVKSADVKIQLPVDEVAEIEVQYKEHEKCKQEYNNLLAEGDDGRRFFYTNYIVKLEKLCADNSSSNVQVSMQALKTIARIYLEGAPVLRHQILWGSSFSGYVITSYESSSSKARDCLYKMRKIDPLAAIDIYVDEINKESGFKELAIAELKRLANNDWNVLSKPKEYCPIAPLLAFYKLCQLGLADEKYSKQILKQAAPLSELFQGIRFLYGIDEKEKTNRDPINALEKFNAVIQQGLLPTPSATTLQASVVACICSFYLCENFAQKIPAQKQKEYCSDAIALGLKIHRSGINKRVEDYLLDIVTKLTIKVQKKYAAPDDAKDKQVRQVSIESNINDLLVAGLDTNWTRFLRLALPPLFHAKQYTEIFFSLAEYMVLHKESFPKLTKADVKIILALYASLPSAELFADTPLMAASNSNYIPALIALAKQWRTLQGNMDKDGFSLFILICSYIYHAIKSRGSLEQSKYYSDLDYLGKELTKIKDAGVLDVTKKLAAQRLIIGFEKLLPTAQTAVTRTDSKVDSKNEFADPQVMVFEGLAKLPFFQKEIQRWRTHATPIEQQCSEDAAVASQLDAKGTEDIFTRLNKYAAVMGRQQSELNTTNTTASTTSTAVSAEGQPSKDSVKDQKSGDEKFQLPNDEVTNIKMAKDKPANQSKADDNFYEMRKENPLAAVDVYITKTKDEKGDSKKLALAELKWLANDDWNFFDKPKEHCPIAPLLAFYKLCGLGLVEEKCGRQILKQAAPLPELFNSICALYGIGKQKDALSAFANFRKIIDEALSPKSETITLKAAMLACIWVLEEHVKPHGEAVERERKIIDCENAIKIGLIINRRDMHSYYLYYFEHINDLIDTIQKKVGVRKVLANDAKDQEMVVSQRLQENIRIFLAASIQTPRVRFLQLALPQLSQQQQFTELSICLTAYIGEHYPCYPKFILAGLKLLSVLQTDLPINEKFINTCLDAAANRNYIHSLRWFATQWRAVQTTLDADKIVFFMVACEHICYTIKKMSPEGQAKHCDRLIFYYNELVKIKDLGILEGEKNISLENLLANFEEILQVAKEQEVVLLTHSTPKNNKAIESRAADYLLAAREALLKLIPLQQAIQDLQKPVQIIWQEVLANLKKAIELDAKKVFTELKQYCVQLGLMNPNENLEPEETGNYVGVIQQLMEKVVKHFNVLDLVFITSPKLPPSSAPLAVAPPVVAPHAVFLPPAAQATAPSNEGQSPDNNAGAEGAVNGSAPPATAPKL